MDYKVVLIILYSPDRRFLLQHRSIDARLLPGYWAFFGGGVGDNESLKEAISREAYEELNYKIENPRLILEQDFKEGDVEGRLYIYAELFSGDKSSLKLKEGQDWGWYSVADTDKLKMVERDRQIIKHISGYLEREELLTK